MQKKTCSLGIDIGTTSVKVIALATDGSLIGQRGRRLEMLHPEEGAAVQDVVAISAALSEALVEMMEFLKRENWHVREVGYSAAMHSILAVDEAGQPLSPAVTWMDTRAKQSADELWASEGGQQLYARTGTPVHPMSPLVKLNRWTRERPEWVRSVHKFVSIKEWIWQEWFGEWVVDESMASATGLYELATRGWDAEALSYAGITEQQVGRLVATTYCVRAGQSEALLQLGFSADTMFNVGATDGVLANLGVGAVGADTLVLTIGTSCAVRVTSERARTDVATRSFCYVLDEERYVLGGPSNSGGIAVERMGGILAGIGVEWKPEDLAENLLAAGEVETGSLLCLPYIAGERAPLWAPDAKAAWLGVDFSHRGVHFLRALVEGVLFNALWIANGLIEMTGQPQRVMVSGKLLEVDWIRQMVADLTGLPVYENQNGDASAVGAVLLAVTAAGRNGECSYMQEMKVTQPRVGKENVYREKFESFKRYAQLLN